MSCRHFSTGNFNNVIKGVIKNFNNLLYVSEKIRAKQSEEAGKIIGNSIFLFGVVAIILTVEIPYTRT